MPRRTSSTTLFSALAAVMLVLLTALSASAHSALVSSTPEDGETLTAMPGSVTLMFNENIQSQGTQVIVADGADVAHPVTPQVEGPKVTATIPEGLPAGVVHVRYRVVSADGHPITGAISFTVAGGPSGVATASGAPAVPAPSANPTPADGDGSTTMMYVLSGVAALVVIGGGLAVFASGRRRR